MSGADARRAARDELAKAIYQRARPGPLDRFLHWIERRVHLVFTGGGGSHALLILLVVLLAGAVVLAVRSGLPTRRVRAEQSADFDPLAPGAELDHRRRAADFAAAGRRPEALREWLRAAVQTIEQRGVLTPRPGRTGAATAREAGPRLPASAPHLSAATAAFDEVWFGGRAATDADVAAARAAADTVRTARIVEAGTTGSLAVPW